MNGRIILLGWLCPAIVVSFVPTLFSQTSTVPSVRRPSANRNAVGPQRPPTRQRTTTTQPTTPRVARNTRPSSMPAGFPLSPERQHRVDRILAFWELNTSKIKTFRAEYKRIEFDPVMGPPGKPNLFAFGVVKYATPDKGLMRDERIYVFNAAPKPGEKQYVLTDQPIGEDWVCDGKAIFMKEPKQSLLIERRLPPELQGKAIAEGPLPFIFGAKAETMKRRFWVREVTPKNNPNGDYFLEAIPKTREDAANYERIVVILNKDNGYLLPKKMEVTIRTFEASSGKNGSAAKSQKRVDIYEFSKTKVNDPNDRVKDFFASFVKPKVPSGWKKEVRDWNLQPISPVATSNSSENAPRSQRSSNDTTARRNSQLRSATRRPSTRPNRN